MWLRLRDFPTTNARIAVSLGLAVGTGMTYLGGVIVHVVRDVQHAPWTPDLEWLAFLCVWAGLDVLQFAGKRLTDSSYTASRQSGTNPKPPEAR